MIDPTVRAAIELAAGAPVLLVASDYDGTLAELVDDPAQARPHDRAIAALRQLAALADTEVAVVSGRSLHDLIVLTGLADDVQLVGSHGSEVEPGIVTGRDGSTLDGMGDTLDRVAAMVHEIAGRAVGTRVERKPASVAFHTREVDPELVADLVAAVVAGPGTLPGVRRTSGKDVVELTVTDAHKGTALVRLRRLAGADAVVFVGDDVTDEDAFAVLGPADVGVKVGPGRTLARHRVDAVDDVAALFEHLAECRRALAPGRTGTP